MKLSILKIFENIFSAQRPDEVVLHQFRHDRILNQPGQGRFDEWDVADEGEDATEAAKRKNGYDSHDEIDATADLENADADERENYQDDDDLSGMVAEAGGGIFRTDLGGNGPQQAHGFDKSSIHARANLPSIWDEENDDDEARQTKKMQNYADSINGIQLPDDRGLIESLSPKSKKDKQKKLSAVYHYMAELGEAVGGREKYASDAPSGDGWKGRKGALTNRDKNDLATADELIDGMFEKHVNSIEEYFAGGAVGQAGPASLTFGKFTRNSKQDLEDVDDQDSENKMYDPDSMEYPGEEKDEDL